MSENTGSITIKGCIYKGGDAEQPVKTLRDEIAIAAMQGMLSRDSHQGGWCPKDESSKQEDGVKRVARFAYEYADAMLIERNKTSE